MNSIYVLQSKPGFNLSPTTLANTLLESLKKAIVLILLEFKFPHTFGTLL